LLFFPHDLFHDIDKHQEQHDRYADALELGTHADAAHNKHG